MFSGVGQKVEIRFAVICADPLAIQTNPGFHVHNRQSIRIPFFIFEYVDQGFVLFGLRRRLFMLIGLRIELKSFGAPDRSPGGFQ